MNDFATNEFRCPSCGHNTFVCYPQTVIDRPKHDWEYTCVRCGCTTVLRTVDS